jgi:hypothetical protein
VHHRETELTCVGEPAGALRLGARVEISVHVVDHGPVHEAHVAAIETRFELRAIDDPTKRPEAGEEAGLFAMRIKIIAHFLHRAWIQAGPAEQPARPGRRELRHIVAPVGITLRAGNNVVFAGEFLEDEADGKRLDILRARLIGRGRLARFGARLRTGDVLGPGQRQKVTVFRGIDKVRRADLDFAVVERTPRHDGANVVFPFEHNRHDAVLAQNHDAAVGNKRRQH